jgi:F-type H+-transporting ATPase subunit delta
MKDKSIAKVWAQALLEMAQEKKKLGAVVDGVHLLRAILDALPQWVDFLASPKIPPDAKKALMDRALKRKADPILLDFCGLLVDRVRGMFLPDILEAFLEIHREAQGILEAHVRCAKPLTGTLETQIRKRLSKLLGKMVELEVTVDPGVIGGLSIQVGDTRFDGTLKRSLNEIAGRLHGARIESEVVYADQD